MKIGVLTSGGDAPGMNAAIRAVVRRAFNLNCECVGYLHGFNGLIKGEWRKMTQASVAGIIQRGGTILRTARSAEFHTLEGRDMAMETLARTGVEGLVVIGGGGSALGAMGLMRNEPAPPPTQREARAGSSGSGPQPALRA